MEQKVEELIEHYEKELNNDEKLSQQSTRDLLVRLSLLYQLKYGNEWRRKSNNLVSQCRSKFYKKHGCFPSLY